MPGDFRRTSSPAWHTKAIMAVIADIPKLLQFVIVLDAAAAAAVTESLEPVPRLAGRFQGGKNLPPLETPARVTEFLLSGGDGFDGEFDSATLNLSRHQWLQCLSVCFQG
jgi:hypothetical protein